MADFIVDFPKKQTHPVNCPREQWWTLHVDGTSKVFGSESRSGPVGTNWETKRTSYSSQLLNHQN